VPAPRPPVVRRAVEQIHAKVLHLTIVYQLRRASGRGSGSAPLSRRFTTLRAPTNLRLRLRFVLMGARNVRYTHR